MNNKKEIQKTYLYNIRNSSKDLKMKISCNNIVIVEFWAILLFIYIQLIDRSKRR